MSSDNKLNMFKQLAEQRKQKAEPVTEAEAPVKSKKKSQPTAEKQEQPKKRGRPATGKRSNEDWVGRTYYIQKTTDLDVEGELFNLKREGVELDKSELVDFLLSQWVKSQQGSKATFRIGKKAKS